ncbi:MAG: ABC transporter permease [Ardenticatenaceae bacterium]|nr:ABC transporter permease [Ardenticatenaceae bacterium]HBY99174.1 peptide ABC transporter [Chloroflexota bacterium]
MTKYIVRRLLWLPVVLVVVSLLTFTLGLYGPGDPVQMWFGQRNNPEAVARIRHEHGFDRPLLVQYSDYAWKVLHGDFGESLKYRGQPVAELIRRGLWISVQINVASMLLGMLVGIPLGVIAALRRNTLLDYLTMSGVVLGISLPVFFVAPILLAIFAWWLRILPPGGWNGLFSRSAALPVLVLTFGPIAVFARQTRANLGEVLDEDYVRTARAKGLPESVVIGRHALRNAFIPLFTIVGLMMGGLVEGAFITETVFGIPGFGRLTVDALFARDYPVIMANILIVAVAYTLANLVIDIGYPLVDPRIRYR